MLYYIFTVWALAACASVPIVAYAFYSAEEMDDSLDAQMHDSE